MNLKFVVLRVPVDPLRRSRAG